MSGNTNDTRENTERSDFERTLGVALGESTLRVSAKVRSRLNQARQAALAEAGTRRAWWRGIELMPAAGAVAAALLLGMILMFRQPGGELLPVGEVPHASAEDLELLADHEGLDLVEGGDGSFYEWAAEQGEAGTQSENRRESESASG